jgi:hypothetical protein
LDAPHGRGDVDRIQLQPVLRGCLVPSAVNCKDLDEAIETATTVPAAWYGTIEVRPVWET